MSQYLAVRDNIIKRDFEARSPYQRIFVVSAYSGLTNLLLEHKKTGEPGIFSLFADRAWDETWRDMLSRAKQSMLSINRDLFKDGEALREANTYITGRLRDAESCLNDLQSLCKHGHFSLTSHLDSVKEMLACIGESHSAYNTTKLLNRDGINAVLIDLTGWNSDQNLSLDERIEGAFKNVDLAQTLPIVTGYAHTQEGLMNAYDRGYSEMTFSRIAVLTGASEAIIHKEYHLSSADPRLVHEQSVVPIGRTNYDVADQLANLGMEAIHPKAAKGLRQSHIPLRIMNTFEPEHLGTLITQEYKSEKPCVEIIAGQKEVYAIELFDQDMTGTLLEHDKALVSSLGRLRCSVVAKDVNANTITHYIKASPEKIKRVMSTLSQENPEAEIVIRRVAIVSAIGSDMKVPGLLAKAVSTLADEDISILAMHQSMRQVDMQFIVEENDYEKAVASLHRNLIEIHDHGRAICLAS